MTNLAQASAYHPISTCKVFFFYRSALEFLAVLEDIEKEFEHNSNEDMKLSLANFARNIHREENDKRHAKISELEYRISESDGKYTELFIDASVAQYIMNKLSVVYVAIQTRYQMRYYNNVVEQFEDEKAMKQNAMRKKIKDIENKISVERYCSQCTIDALYAEINVSQSGDQQKNLNPIFVFLLNDIVEI